LKLTDFGVSDVFCGEHPGARIAGGQCGKNMEQPRLCSPGICGSKPYISPEVVQDVGINEKREYDPRALDAWSCAMVYLTMCYGGPIFGAATYEDAHYVEYSKAWDAFLEKHPDGKITDEKGGMPNIKWFDSEIIGSPALKRLMFKMLHPDPLKRLSVSDALRSPTMRGVECCSPESNEGSSNASVDAGSLLKSKSKVNVQKKHHHLPPKEHKMPKVFQHRFDMGDGW